MWVLSLQTAAEQEGKTIEPAALRTFRIHAAGIDVGVWRVRLWCERGRRTCRTRRRIWSIWQRPRACAPRLAAREWRRRVVNHEVVCSWLRWAIRTCRSLQEPICGLPADPPKPGAESVVIVTQRCHAADRGGTTRRFKQLSLSRN